MTATDVNRAVGPTEGPVTAVREQLLRESGSQRVPLSLLEESYRYLGSDDLPRERYFSQAQHDLEVERVWRRVWQMACREEDIPEVGDTHVYDIAEDSILVVRTAEDRIQAYYNSCLHRGTQLRTIDGNVPAFVCPFHGWTWSLEGDLIKMPCGSDFPHVDPAACSLPQVQVGTWDGWVFVNMDPDAPPLMEYLENLPELMAEWPMAPRVKVAHVAARVACNWKVLLEAFIEAYHAYTSHPQFVAYADGSATQYDVYGDHVSRMIGAQAITGYGPSEEEMARAMVRDYQLGDPDEVVVPEGATARDVVAETMRRAIGRLTGVDLSSASNTELVDGIEFLLFPNFLPWGGYGIPIVYRYRPDGCNPESSIVDVMLLAPIPEGIKRPPPAPVHWLESDDWTEAPEIGVLGPANNQDMSNLPRVQRGLKSSRKPGVTLANYHEVRIRHHAQTLDKYLART